MNQQDRRSIVTALLTGCKIHSTITVALAILGLCTRNNNFYTAAAFTFAYMCYTFLTAYYIWNLETIGFLTVIVGYTSVIPNCAIGWMLYIIIAKACSLLAYIFKKIGGEK